MARWNKPNQFSPILAELMEQGKNEQAARRIIGGWIKLAGGDAGGVLEVAKEAIERGVVDLNGYVYGAIRKKARDHGRHGQAVSMVASIMAGE